MKQRFSSLDVKVIAHELSHALCTLRLANAYDLSSRIFLLKFAKPGNRQSLVIESGFRCHLTDYSRETATAPSAFVARLRKYLKTRRVTSVSQIGTDRIIELQFSDGQYRLFLEFYAGGNIVLTDRESNVIGLLRVVNEEKEHLQIGLRYTLDGRQNYHSIPALTSERVSSGLERAIANEDGGTAILQGKKFKRKPSEALRRALVTSLNEFPPTLIDHVLQRAEFDVKVPVDQVLKDESLLGRLMVALEEAQRIVNNIADQQACRGYIVARSEAPPLLGTQEDPGQNGLYPRKNVLYEDFHPFRPQQFEGKPGITILEFDGFNKTVDEFFSSVESQKLELKLTEREQNAKKKLETARLDHQRRLGGLQQVQVLNVRKAQAIEANLQKVQEAIAAVNGLLAQGMDWMDVARLIEIEQEKHNVVAELIKLPLKLFENTITLLLAEASFEQEDEYDGDETDSEVSDVSEDEQLDPASSSRKPAQIEKRLAIDVDLSLSPWSNARQYYDQKKHAAVKEQKTIQSSEKALKSTERKINTDLQKGLKQEKDVMRPLRKAFWFEKFVWFISSEGYLVIGGKDLQQAEILYKRYLKKGDVYVHADLQGAISVIVKNKPGMVDGPIPPSTLSQAGTLTVASSTAWESKAVMSAWWVNADQVSKTTPNGDYLTAGCFHIHDHKQFLPPAQLLLGFGLLFQVSESSTARHLKHRFRDEHDPVPDRTFQSIDANTNSQEEMLVDDQAEGGREDAESKENHWEHDDSKRSDGGTSDDTENSDSGSEYEHDNPLQPGHRGNAASALREALTTPQESNHTFAAETTTNEPSSESEHQLDNDEEKTSNKDENCQVPTESDTSANISSVSTTMPVTHDSEDDTQLPTTANSKPSSTATHTGKKSQSIPIRGKHGKRNKLKTKYAEQDEEDRDLAMRLLGSATAKQRATEEVAAKATKEQELAAQKDRRRQQHALAVAKGKEAEELRKLNFQEGAEILENDETEEQVDLDGFVGAPLPGDEILQALVVCAPWSAIGGRCRWSVKLQPGSTKKGKAVREILGKWNHMITDREKKKRPGSGEGNEDMLAEEELRKREGELIRGIREPEVIGLVPVGKVRIAMGAGEAGGKGRGSAAAGKGKRGGKGSKKQR